MAASLAASMAGVVLAFRCSSGLPEGVLPWTDCVRACDLVEGALPSWLDPGTLVDNPRESFEVGGGMAFLSAWRASSAAALSAPSRCAISGSWFSLSTTSCSFLSSVEPGRANCGNRLIRFDFGEVFVGVGRPENPGCRDVQRKCSFHG